MIQTPESRRRRSSSRRARTVGISSPLVGSSNNRLRGECSSAQSQRGLHALSLREAGRTAIGNRLQFEKPDHVFDPILQAGSGIPCEAGRNREGFHEPSGAHRDPCGQAEHRSGGAVLSVRRTPEDRQSARSPIAAGALRRSVRKVVVSGSRCAPRRPVIPPSGASKDELETT